MARLSKKAIKEGVIPEAHEVGCNRCGEKRGIVEYHNHNYDDPVKFLEPLCYRCHMLLHNFKNNPTVVNEYFELIWQLRSQGYLNPYEPVTDRKSFYNVMYDMGVFTKDKTKTPQLILPEKYQAWLESIAK